jgi:O-antigen/teichoic acid export membrane protein
MSGRHHAPLVSGRSATLLTNGGLLASGILTSILVSRVLGPTGRGHYVTWQTWAATIGIFALGGLPQVLVLDHWTPGRHKPRELVAPLALTVGAALAVLAGLSAFLRPDWIVLTAAVLVVLANQFGSLGASEAQRMGRMGIEFNLARIVPQAASLLAMVGLLVLRSGSYPAWLTGVAVCQAGATALWLWYRSDRGARRPVSARPTVTDSVRLAPGSWVTLLQYRFDLLAVTALFRPEIVAFYATGLAASGAVLAAGQSRGMHWFSRQGGMFTNRPGALGRELRRTAGIALAVAAPLALLGRVWVAAAYGSAFLPAVPIVAVLCGVGVIQSVDYLLAHECLIVGLGSRVLLFRLPSIAAVAAGFGLASAQHWPAAAIAVVPGAGYALSSAVFLVAIRSRRAVTPSAPPVPEPAAAGAARSR